MYPISNLKVENLILIENLVTHFYFLKQYYCDVNNVWTFGLINLIFILVEIFLYMYCILNYLWLKTTKKNYFFYNYCA